MEQATGSNWRRLVESNISWTVTWLPSTPPKYTWRDATNFASAFRPASGLWVSAHCLATRCTRALAHPVRCRLGETCTRRRCLVTSGCVGRTKLRHWRLPQREQGPKEAIAVSVASSSCCCSVSLEEWMFGQPTSWLCSVLRTIFELV